MWSSAFLAALTALRVAGPLSPRNASYSINARLDAQAKTLTARQTITWRNDDLAQATELRLHLYLNAFKHSQTLFLREMSGGRGLEGFDHEEPSRWGYIDTKRIVAGGQEVQSELLGDGTVLRVPLATPVQPGETLAVEIDFEAKLPRLLARTGFHGDFFMVAQWFPKLGVFEDGRWKCHEFHPNGEFYADFGVYQVRLDVPAGYLVGASGVLGDRRLEGDREIYQWLAEDVHDFAWTAAPFLRELSGSWRDVQIRVLYGPGNAPSAQRHLRATVRALETASQRLFPYPYRTLTVLTPPPGATAAGGMEYPTLFTTIDAWWVPQSARIPEATTVHEFGHQYFYGLLANNEYEEAWLDEGINSYFATALIDEWYGPGASLLDTLGLRLGALHAQQLGLARWIQWDPIVQDVSRYVGASAYGRITYAKSTVLLKTLEGVIGRQKMAELMREYSRRFRFRHPRTGDFLALAEEVAGRSLDWLLSPGLYGTDSLDYAVTSVESRPVRRAYGVIDGDRGRREVDEEDVIEEEPKQYEARVVVHRRGTFRAPVQIEVAFEDGSQLHMTWQGRERWKRLTFKKDSKVRYAKLDPDGLIPLDSNPLNNGQYREPHRQPATRMALLWQTIAQTLLQMLGL